jgi:hypothetical protein
MLYYNESDGYKNALRERALSLSKANTRGSAIRRSASPSGSSDFVMQHILARTASRLRPLPARSGLDPDQCGRFQSRCFILQHSLTVRDMVSDWEQHGQAGD